MVPSVLFAIFAGVLVLSALGVIIARNPVHSALLLILCFFTSAVLWLLLEAEFLALVLVLVYVGAVMVLFLFVIMMLDVNVTRMREGFTRYAPLGAIVSGIIILQLAGAIWLRSGLPAAEPLTPREAGHSNTRELGAVLYTEHVYAFELAAFILLLAIIAAIMLTLRQRPGLKVQDVSAQVKVQRKDRVRLVKMDAEKDS
ncbi:MAG: NADH-quinone oxidoreductase subunit J [Chromatiales bacterium]|nr:NADH-quinone oxidoreductase subunit J [Chromatiales bacterium]